MKYQLRTKKKIISYLYNMKQLIEFNDILASDLFELVDSKSKELLDSANSKRWKTWDENIRDLSKPVHIVDVPSDLQEKVYDDLKLNQLYMNGNIFSPTHMMFYYWLPGSYIPWHTDSAHEAGMTIHLNDNWLIKYGGLFNYYEENSIQGIKPEKNLGVLQIGGIGHSTTIISSTAPIRRTLQMFFKTREIKESII